MKNRQIRARAILNVYRDARKSGVFRAAARDFARNWCERWCDDMGNLLPLSDAPRCDLPPWASK